MDDVGTWLFKKVRGKGNGPTVYDENIALTFAVSTLASWRNSPNAERFTFPLDVAEPKSIKQVWATILWCAERKAGVDAMRDDKVTFLWMSDLTVVSSLTLFVNGIDLADRQFVVVGVAKCIV
jgi:hypothetical protein